MATAPQLRLIPAPKDTMIAARQDGRLYVVNFREYPQLDDPASVDWTLSVSKMIVGKLEQNRTRWLTLEELEFENVTKTDQPAPGTSTDMGITIYGSQDGKNIDHTITPIITERDGTYVQAKCRVTARNFQVQLRGTYNVNTIQLTYHNHGKR